MSENRVTVRKQERKKVGTYEATDSRLWTLDSGLWTLDFVYERTNRETADILRTG